MFALHHPHIPATPWRAERFVLEDDVSWTSFMSRQVQVKITELRSPGRSAMSSLYGKAGLVPVFDHTRYIRAFGVTKLRRELSAG